MSLPYDEEIFKRGQFGGLVLSQRFKHICYSFRDTFKTAGQLISANVILRALPHSIFYGLLQFLIYYIYVLYIIFISEILDNKRGDYKVRNMIDVSYSCKKVVESIGNLGFFIILSYISIASILSVVFLERNYRVSYLYSFLTFVALFILIQYFFKSPSTGQSAKFPKKWGIS